MGKRARRGRGRARPRGAPRGGHARGGGGGSREQNWEGWGVAPAARARSARRAQLGDDEGGHAARSASRGQWPLAALGQATGPVMILSTTPAAKLRPPVQRDALPAETNSREATRPLLHHWSASQRSCMRGAWVLRIQSTDRDNALVNRSSQLSNFSAVCMEGSNFRHHALDVAEIHYLSPIRRSSR